jgi:protoporphyrinogen/coproporphyrinogen III oxidase
MSGAGPRVVVVGGGVTGLTAAYRLRRTRPDLGVTLVETSARLGGKILTEHVDGFVVEGGADSLVTFKPQAVALASELGLTPRLRAAEEAEAGSYVCSGGRMLRMPDGLAGFVPRRIRPLATTRLLSPAAKVRLALEHAVPARTDEDDESVESFVTRRLGAEFYRCLVEPMASGIFGSDPAELSLQATMPHLRAAERQHGSLTRFVLAQRRRGRGHRAAGRAPAVTAPMGGVGELVDALAGALDDVEVLTGTRLVSLEPTSAGGYLLRLSGADAPGCAITADAVVLAVPAHDVARVTRGLAPGLADVLRTFGQGSTVTVNLGYAEGRLPLEGHGCLVPAHEGRAARACTWSSRKFAGRAPEGHTLLRVSLGGADRPSLTRLDDDHLVRLAREEVAVTTGVTAEPVLARVHVWDQVMPHYAVGHPGRVARLERVLSRYPGVVLAGSAFHGVSIPDCVASAERAAAAVLAALTESPVVAAPG